MNQHESNNNLHQSIKPEESNHHHLKDLETLFQKSYFDQFMKHVSLEVPSVSCNADVSDITSGESIEDEAGSSSLSTMIG